VPRQIDISIRKQVGQYPILIVIDCKDYKEPLDVKDVETFAGMVKDVRANRGAIIASSGFTEAAVNVARNHGIDTFRCVDTESVDWKSYVAIPVLLVRTYPQKFSLGFSGAGRMVLPSSITALLALEMRTDDGVSLGNPRQVLNRKWDRNEMPRKPGTHEVVLGENVVIEYENTKSHVNVSASVIVVTEFYFGPLPVQFKGLQDIQGGGIITKSLRTGSLEPWKIEQGIEKDWKKIEDPEQLAVLRPMLQLSYYDVFSDDVVPDQPEDK
jgi:hypothetical protein